MNRKDLIIVAVLVNSGLLIALFISAVSSSQDTAEFKKTASLEQPVLPEAVPAFVTKQKADQIDKIISLYDEKPVEKETLPQVSSEKKEAPFQKQPPAAQPAETFRTITVAKGDVLEKIARLHGVKVDDIIELNHLEGAFLKVGQELKLPKAITAKKLSKQNEESGKFYIVKGGDNPWTIAQKNHMQVEDLLKLNNMDEAKAKKLRPGDQLKIK